ncbi:glycosyltransferase [Citrobacter gillenii]|uniref:glycosyltransferase n=1 Tax=Citrobacter gillenii TaxID=67828 RepID=UPI00311CD3FF
MMTIALLWLTILLFKCVFARKILRAPRPESFIGSHDVTVLQPILSGDPALSSVLETNLQQLPDAHFLWLIDDDDDEGARVSRQLQQRYPQCDIRLLRYAPAPQGLNPKLFKLEQARSQVQTSCLMVLDDDTSLDASSLQHMLSELNAHTLVTALPWYRPAHNIPSRLLAQFVNDNSALTYLPLLPFTRPLTLNGMCYVIYRDTLAQVGGFTPILHHLTDDLALATLLTRQGIEIVQSTATVQVQTSVPDLRRYARQMHRWFLFATLLMREKTVSVNLAIFLLQGLHPLLLWSMLILALSGGAADAVILTGVVIIRYFALRCVQHGLSELIPAHPMLSLLSELLQPVHLLHAMLNRTIYWRSRRYRIFSNDRFISR